MSERGAENDAPVTITVDGDPLEIPAFLRDWLPNGVEIDLTRDQFPEWTPGEFATRDRAYVLSFEPTQRRYAALLRDVLAYLTGAP